MKTLYQLSLALLMFSALATPNLFAGSKVNETVDLGGNRQATWYLPDSPSNGWVLLQHGFQRNKSNLDDLATHLMDNGIMVLTINSDVSNGNPSLARNIADDLVDNPLTPPNNMALPNKLVIAGHSAGGLFMSHLGGRLVERSYANLYGAILFDPVDKNNGMQPTLQSMIDNNLPVLSILANSGSCNSSNNALQPLRNLTSSYVGIKLTDNSKHTDVEGSSTGGIITWLCGSPKAHNIAYLQDFALHWAQDMISGNITADYYPNGNKVNELLAANDGELIKEITIPPIDTDFSFTVSDLSVQFNNQSDIPNGVSVTYQWDFGDGQTSTQENPSHDYSSAGTYTVKLTVTGDNGAIGNASKNMTLVGSNEIPGAGFTYVANNLTVNFTDTSTDSDGSITSWSWDFGDGSSSTLENPTHTFAQAGTYQVTLEVTDNDGLTDITTQNITVVGPDDDFLENGAVVNNLAAAQGEEIHYKIQVPDYATDLTFNLTGGTGDADIYVRYGAAPTSSQWDYRPYKNGNEENVSVASPQGGVWYLMVRAYRNFSGVTLSVNYLDSSVNLPPQADFSHSASGLSVNFIDNSSDQDGSITSWHWAFGDGATSQQANPGHSYATAGDYTVTLTVSDNNNVVDQISKVITVSETSDGVTVISNGDVISNIAASTGEEVHYKLVVPANTAAADFVIYGGYGDADIYVRYGAKATTSSWDYRPYKSGNDESVSVASPQAGEWYVMIRAYSNYSGLTLNASHTVN